MVRPATSLVTFVATSRSADVQPPRLAQPPPLLAGCCALEASAGADLVALAGLSAVLWRRLDCTDRSAGLPGRVALLYARLLLLGVLLLVSAAALLQVSLVEEVQGRAQAQAAEAEAVAAAAAYHPDVSGYHDRQSAAAVETVDASGLAGKEPGGLGRTAAGRGGAPGRSGAARVGGPGDVAVLACGAAGVCAAALAAARTPIAAGWRT